MKKLILFFFLAILLLPLSTAFAQEFDCAEVSCFIEKGKSCDVTSGNFVGMKQFECCCYKIELRESIGDTDILTGKSGMDLLTQYIAMIYKYGASILGIICVLIIVVSGIQISMGGAQADLVSQAKTRIFQALLSLAILFLSAVILRTINPGFFTL